MGNSQTVRFSERQAEAMARYLAELERQGIAYVTYNMCDGWSIEITGY